MRRAMSVAECSPDSSNSFRRFLSGPTSSDSTPGSRSAIRRSMVSSARSSPALNQSPGNCQSALSATLSSRQ